MNIEPVKFHAGGYLLIGLYLIFKGPSCGQELVVLGIMLAAYGAYATGLLDKLREGKKKSPQTGTTPNPPQ